MIKDDFVIQSEVRRMLIRTNIDYTKIDFGTVRGVVYLRGFYKLSRIYADGDEEEVRGYTAKTLFSFEKKIRSIPGVSDVVFQFINWRKEKGKWIPVELKKKEEKDENRTDSEL
ncbi:MAG: hypothetical protein QME90_10080 [Thermodesulfobacteriota bacterium]|nr:hypothetical protein [Thermodesulfobacteriota bacterium]